MLTEQEKTRLDELSKKEALTPDEVQELSTLEAANETTPDNEDEFGKAFVEFTNEDEEDQDKEGSAQDTTTSKEKEVADQPGPDEEGESPSDSVFDGTPAESDKQDSTGKDPEDPRDKKISELEQKMKSWDGRIQAEKKRADEAERKLIELENQDKSKTDKPLPDGEDEKILQDFFNEFPDLQRPIEVMINKVAAEIVEKKFGSVESELKRVKDTAEEVETERHYATIAAAHPDWKDIVSSGSLQRWIDRQPSFVKDTLNRIVDRGKAEEIIEMFDSYKKSTGKSQTSTSNTGDAQARKAQSLAAVPAQSAGPPKTGRKTVDKDDFDGAWKEAISKN